MIRLSPVQTHATRTVFAALLALGLAYLFELETPYSAATTVLIVAHPMHGMIVSKSLYRFGGTLLGAVMAITLMALFAQSPEMFFLGLSLWMGLCTCVSTLLRSFRSYGAVLAGYTVVLITMPGIDHPENVFTLAVSRASVVALGIVCSALVASLTAGRQAEQTLDAKLRQTLRKVAAYARRSLEGAPARELSQTRRALAAEIAALDALVEFAAIETAVGMTELEDALRSAALAMFGTLSAAASAHGALERLPAERHPEDLREAFLAILDALAADPADLSDCRARLLALEQSLEERISADDLPLTTALDRLDELAEQIRFATEGALALTGGAPLRRIKVWRHRDLSWGLINGLRACIAVWLAAALWTVTAWPSGATMVAMIVPNIGLLALRDRPSRDAIDFVIGTILASGVGLLYLCLILPSISGFPLLALVLAPPLLIGVAASMKPRTVFIGVGFYVFFITLLAPANPMSYDPTAFLNGALVTIGGAVITVAAYRLILPVSPRRHVLALVRAIQQDLQSLLRNSAISRDGWEGRMHERLIALGARMRAAGAWQDGLLRGGFASLRLGREVLRLRSLLSGDAEAWALCRPAAGALLEMNSHPLEALEACRQSADSLALLAASREAEAARPPVRAAASLTEIAVLLGRHRRFFQKVPA